MIVQDEWVEQKETHRAEMEVLCDQANCDDEERKKHIDSYVYGGWHSHPPPEFVTWWAPSGRDELTGADIGGHTDAFRQWSRKDPGRFERRTYGIATLVAWNIFEYRAEYYEWIEFGRPERPVFTSLALPLEEQHKLFIGMRETLSQIAKPMPKIDKPPAGKETNEEDEIIAKWKD